MTEVPIIETSPLIWCANHCTGFCMIGTSIMKELTQVLAYEIESSFFLLSHHILYFNLVSQEHFSVLIFRSICTLSPSVLSEEKPYVFDFPTPSRHVRAVGLRAPLQLSNKLVNFKLPAGYLDMKIQTYAGRKKVL